MAFQQVADLDADTTIQLGGVNKKTGKKNPIQVEGYFLGSKEVASPKSKGGKAKLHIFQTSSGNVGVWGKTNLDSKLLTAPAGAMIRATFERMVPTPNGDMYKYKVEVDRENTIDVPNASASAVDNSEDDGGQDDTNEYTEDDADAEEEAQNQALLAAERKAKALAALSKNRKA